MRNAACGPGPRLRRVVNSISCLSYMRHHRSDLWHRDSLLLSHNQCWLWDSLWEFNSQKVAGGDKWQSMSWTQIGDMLTPAQAEHSTNWPSEQSACFPHRLAASLGSPVTSLINIFCSLHYWLWKKQIMNQTKLNCATMGFFLLCQTKPEPLFWSFCLI